MNTVRHTAKTRARAVALLEAGWRPVDVQRLLAAEGHPVPSRGTLWTWANPDRAAAGEARRQPRQNAQKADAARFTFPGPPRSPEFRLAFMRRLRDEGAAMSSIAATCRVVFDDPSMTEWRVRYALRHHKREIAA